MTALPEYRLRARNCSTDSENTIHADEAARQFGFQGGLVPGIVIFGYAIQPLLDSDAIAWLERGSISIKLQQPVYDGDALVVRTHSYSASGSVEIALSAERHPEVLCASVEAALIETGVARIPPDLKTYPQRPLPKQHQRPMASPELLAPGTILGTVTTTLDSSQSRVFEALNETNPIFLGPRALAHPAVLLELANQSLMQNVRLGPWLHASSSVTNWRAAHNGDVVQVRSRVAGCYERKGHEFVVLDLVILGTGDRLIQHVTHTAIFRPKFIAALSSNQLDQTT